MGYAEPTAAEESERQSQQCNQAAALQGGEIELVKPGCNNCMGGIKPQSDQSCGAHANAEDQPNRDRRQKRAQERGRKTRELHGKCADEGWIGCKKLLRHDIAEGKGERDAHCTLQSRNQTDHRPARYVLGVTPRNCTH